MMISSIFLLISWKAEALYKKKNLSEKIVTELKLMFPEVPIISINIRDFEKATYCNKSMV
ncbi:hypothetical protein TASCI_10098 [Tenacibaculum ascidiaceicola]